MIVLYSIDSIAAERFAVELFQENVADEDFDFD